MRKMQFLKSLICLVLATTVFNAWGQKTTSTQAPGPTTSTETVAGQIGTPKLITPGYLRMHHPDFLVALAKRVAAGGAPKSDLVNAAGASFTETLLKANLSAIPTPTKRGTTITKGPELRAIYHTMGMPVQVEPSDYSPHSLDYPLMIPGELESQSINIMSRTDGVVTASVSNLPADFKILLMRSYDGTVSGSDSTETVDLTSTNGSLAVTGGQNFSVIVQVGSSTSGTFSANLNLHCTGNSVNAGQYWDLTIPMKIVVSPSNNYRAAYEGYNPQLMVYPGELFWYKIQITPVNYAKPFDATISTTSFGGLSAEPVKLHFGSSAPVTATIYCKCAPGAQIQDNVFMFGMITADNNEKTLFYTQVDVCPFQMKVDYGSYYSAYNVSGYQPFGSVGSYWEKYDNMTVLFDVTGRYQFLGAVIDSNGGVFPPSYWESGAPFGVYIADYQGHFHGSYNETQGKTSFIVSMWDDFSKGIIKSGVWFEPAHMTKYFNGNLPPIDKNGNFTAFQSGVNIPIQHW